VELVATQISVPAGNETKPDLVIDLAAIQVSEARQSEVATVTPVKAGELLAEYNRSWAQLHELTTRLEVEKNRAKRAVDQRKAVLLLDDIPRILKEKGVASAADTRQAVIDRDEAYVRLSERLEAIEAVIALLKGKAKSFENAYTSVKKIMGDDAYNMADHKNNRLSGNTYVPAQTAKTEVTPGRPARAGFGKARYDK
jgi:hypothetical protein